MDWSRTKTIFIVTFMLLNIFLGYQLAEKQRHGDINEIEQMTLDSQIEEQRITIEFEETEEELTGAPITGVQRSFEDDITFLEQTLERQQIDLIDSTTLYSELDSPYNFSPANLTASTEAFMQQYVFRGEEYQLAAYDEEEGLIGLYQTFEGSMIDQYERDSYHVVLELNDSGQIVSYTQRYLTIVEQGAEEELLTPMQVVERLINDPQVGIGTDSTISSATVGYYNLMEVDANFQIYAPVWRVIVDDEPFFVNALTGEVQNITS
ncbi:two-component system regulatory protein YycI [Bacillus daqingensis]|uniref:Two-component system regulatory protein YycI n=1 Tax=Bacillus daqingensis TaxID=872396 RepID=A0ABV9NSL8_9BACI